MKYNLRVTQSVWIWFIMINYIDPDYVVVIIFCYYCHEFQIISSSMAAFHMYDIDIAMGNS